MTVLNKAALEATLLAVATRHFAERFDRPHDDPLVIMNANTNWHIFEPDVAWTISAYLAALIPQPPTLPVSTEESGGAGFYLELREPGCVPERKGRFPTSTMVAKLRECMAARPAAFITVITFGTDGEIMLQDGPETLQMLDGRSMETGRKHIASSGAAFAAISPKQSGAQQK